MDAQESPPLGLLLIGALIAAVIVACLAIVLLRGGRSGGWATKFAASIITGAALFAVMGTLHPIAKGVAVVAAVAMIAAALDRIPVRVAAVVAAALIGLSTYLAFYGHRFAAGQDFTALLLVPLAGVAGSLVALLGMATNSWRKPAGAR